MCVDTQIKRLVNNKSNNGMGIDIFLLFYNAIVEFYKNFTFTCQFI